MNNFTTNTYEMKKEIVNFSKKVTKGLNKPTTKFVMDMEYGIAKSINCLISNILRNLDEDIKLKDTIERFCDNLVRMSDNEYKIIENNYLEEVKKILLDELIFLFDDSDISKRYGVKFEDLDKVLYVSRPKKENVNGYHICEAVSLIKNELQPISIYSKIYSCKSKGFKSKNEYTKESLDRAIEITGRRSNFVFDRGYGDNKIIDYVDKSNNNLVIRMDDNRTFLFKGKKKNCHEEAIRRKGKIRMELWFDDNEVYASHTKVTLPYNKKDYELVIVYGLSEEHPMILLTNRSIHSKEDVIKVVRLYFYRWRIEEYFRAKKQEYDFKNIRVRTLRTMNNLNLLLTVHLGHIGILTDKMDKKLLAIKIMKRSKSLRNKIIVWLSQITRCIYSMLTFAHTGIKEWQNIEERNKIIRT